MSETAVGGCVRRPQFLFCTMGTWGDIKPFCSIAVHLKKRGARVRILTNSNWRDEVLDRGLEFEPIAPADPPQTDRDDLAFFRANYLPSFARSYDIIANELDGDTPPIIVYRSNMLGAACAAEKFQLPHACILLQPSAFRSTQRPSWPMTWMAEGRFGRFGGKKLVPITYWIGLRLSAYRRDIRAFRRKVGLPANPSKETLHGSSSLMLCPDWFAMPQADWPETLVCTGFPLEKTLPKPLQFQRETIIFTSGTGNTDTLEYSERAERIARALDMDALLLSSQETRKVRRSPYLTTSPFVDLAAVLPQAKAIIHHGGIGTIAEALRAGIPQLIIANRYDQPDNAVRIAQLGLGGAILEPKTNIETVISTLRRIFDDADMASHLSKAAQLIAHDEALERACANIERLA